jgi:hypothetical protein
MRFTLSLCLLAAAAYAQSPPPAETPLGRPPGKVDKALRARITEFYQDQVAGRFREAEALVASDTKDLYYSSTKSRLLSFEIKSISYFDKYKHASVQISSKRYIDRVGFTNIPMTLPFTSTWKIERGKWVWYVDPETQRQTAFGIKLPAGATAPTQEAQAPLPNIAASLGLAGKVRADRSALAIKQGESGEIVFSSASPGIAVVSLDGSPEGFQVTPEQVLIKQNETAKVQVKALGSAAAATLKFKVDPAGDSIEVNASLAK